MLCRGKRISTRLGHSSWCWPVMASKTINRLRVAFPFELNKTDFWKTTTLGNTHFSDGGFGRIAGLFSSICWRGASGIPANCGCKSGKNGSGVTVDSRTISFLTVGVLSWSDNNTVAEYIDILGCFTTCKLWRFHLLTFEPSSFDWSLLPRG